MSEGDREKSREDSPEWHRTRAEKLRKNGFTKMAEEHEQIARMIESQRKQHYRLGRLGHRTRLDHRSSTSELLRILGKNSDAGESGNHDPHHQTLRLTVHCHKFSQP